MTASLQQTLRLSRGQGLSSLLAAEEEKVLSLPRQLASWVQLKLVESETLWLFRLDGTLVSHHSEEAEQITTRNAEYKLCCELNRDAESKLTREESSQTASQDLCYKIVQTDDVVKRDTGCLATTWDLYESVRLESNEDQNEVCPDILKNFFFVKNFDLMESMISLNLYHSMLKVYRTDAAVVDLDYYKPDDVVLLWALHPPPEHEDQRVTCMNINPLIHDVVCVGYASGLDSECGGLCCWSLKNLLHPREVFSCPSAVTTVCFSKSRPNILACGLFDGTVRIYSISPPNGKLLVDSRDLSLYHRRPIRSLKFAVMPTHLRMDDSRRRKQMHEAVVSVAEDGTVKKWILSSPLKAQNLLLLSTRSCATIGAIPKPLMQFEPLFDLDWLDGDDLNDKYVLGCGCGSLHFCSLYEQTRCLSTIKSHVGPVVRVCPSPTSRDVFLTCGFDWIVRLWKDRLPDCLFLFQTGQVPIYEVCWSPLLPTVFASVSAYRVDVWDLNRNLLEPVINWKPPRKEQFTTITFSATSNSLFVGCSSGKVCVYRLLNVIAVDNTKLIQRGDNVLSAVIEDLVARLQKKKRSKLLN